MSRTTFSGCLWRHPAKSNALRRHRYAPFDQRTTRMRLLHVRSPSLSIAMETGRAVLAVSRVRSLKRQGNLRPNRNRRGSPDQRRVAIQRRKSLCTRVSAVRIPPANPFENRGNSASGERPERVRKGDSGGESGIRTRETVSRLHTFQACAFDHSATSPVRADNRSRRPCSRAQPLTAWKNIAPSLPGQAQGMMRV